MRISIILPAAAALTALALAPVSPALAKGSSHGMSSHQSSSANHYSKDHYSKDHKSKDHKKEYKSKKKHKKKFVFVKGKNGVPGHYERASNQGKSGTVEIRDHGGNKSGEGPGTPSVSGGARDHRTQ
jgi:hypothetical protein